MGILAKLTRVEMLLRHVLYLSYLAPEAHVRGLVPDVLPLSVVDGDKAFVSIVILQSTGVHLSPLPFPSFTYNQVNLRTYVIDPRSGNQAVFFLKSGVTSSVISFLTRSIGIPWQLIDVQLKTVIDKRNRYMSYEASGTWVEQFSILAEESPTPPARIYPFADIGSAIHYLVRPLIGFFSQSGRISRFSIWHPDVEPRTGILKKIHFPLLNSLNIVDGGLCRNPDSIFLVPSAHFYIYMPPARVRVTK